MNLQLDLLTNFNTACRFVSLHRQLKTRLTLLFAFQGYSPQKCATPYRWNRKDSWRNDSTNQDILPHPPRGVHVQW